MDELREWLLSEIEKLEEENLTARDDVIVFNNGRIHQCNKVLHELYKLNIKG